MTRAMKDSGIEWIGEIPKDWSISKYKYYSDNRMGETILVEDTNIEEGVPIYSATQDDKILGYVKNPSLVLHKGDFVIPARGNSIGCVSVVKEDVATCTQTTICSRNIKNINKDFLFYCSLGLHSEWFKYEGSAIPQVTVNQIKNNLVPIPSMPEQQKIADFLDEKCSHIDSVLEKVRASIDEYKQLKQSVITQAVTKGIRPNRPMKDSGIEWIGEIPQDWKVYPLKYLVDIPITDGTHNTPTYTDKENGSPFLSSKDITSGHIDWSSIKYITKELHEQLQKEVAPKRNDILLAKNGTTGIGALVEEDIVFDIYVTLALIRPNQSIVLPKFLLYLINSSLCKIQYDKHLIGIGVPNLHLNIINNVKVIITDAKDEQQEIVSYLDDKCSKIDKLITKKEQLIAELETYKKSLIYEYVTGKKEVK